MSRRAEDLDEHGQERSPHRSPAVVPAGDAVPPYGSVQDAVDAILDELDIAGLGRWRLGELTIADCVGDHDLIVPVVLPDDSTHYALKLDCAESMWAPTDDRLRRVRHAGRLLGLLMATSNRAAELSERADRAERESTTDDLTGLPNARAWWRILAREADRCDRFGLTAVVAVVDLDNLKEINDRDGHLAGDLLIRGAAHALLRTVASTDIVARLGGDEFGLLVLDQGQSAVDEFRDRVHALLVAQGVQASVGASSYLPSGRINDAYHAADVAMYEHKRTRRTHLVER